MFGEAREVVCADSPETADVTAEGIDLWVLDRQRLQELGIDALEAYKDREPTVASPVLLVTPESRPSQLDPALWSHVDDILGPPVRQAELSGRIRALLRMRQYSVDAEEARNELKERWDLLNRIQDAAGVGGWEYDPERDRVFGTDHLAELLGRSDVAGFQLEEALSYYPPKSREKLREAVRHCLQAAEPFDLELRFVPEEGEKRWGRVRGAPRIEDGEVVRILGTLRDLTDRKEAQKETEWRREQLAAAERKRRERKVERLRKKYEGLLQVAPDAIFVAEKTTGKIVEANQAAADLLDTTVESVVGRRVLEVHPREERDRYRTLFEECGALEDRKTFSRFEDGSPLFVVTDSGERIPVEMSATPVEFENREYLVGIVRDVRRRCRAQRRQRIFERAVEHSGDAIFITDPEGEIQYVNPATEEITGYEEEELIGQKPRFWQSGETPDEVYERFWNTIQQGEVARHTFRNQTKEGALIELDQVVVPIEGPSGEIQRYVSMGRDVTEQKEAQRQLREVSERLRATIEAAPVPVLALDLDGDVQLWNPAAERTFGWSEDEVRGEPLPIVPEEKQSEFAALRHRVEQGETITGREIRRRLKSGDWVDLRLFAAPMHDDQGDVFGIMAALEDITEEKQRERQLRAAKREAEEANRTQSAFLANMSHEIRTPLTSIIGFAEALGTEASEMELPRGSALPKYAELIEQSGKRLLETLEGVLNLSKLEAGQMELGAEPVNLATEAQRTAEELRPKAQEKEVNLRLEVDDVQAEADEGGVQIVARNLLSNAIKYTEEGGTVWARTYREGSRAALEIEDTGIGMEPLVVENLFEPFRQASEGWNREYEGTGVGLAVTKEATEQMGGAIEVETEKGEGSRFVVRLPRFKDEEFER